MEFSQLKENYKFLEEILNFYDELDQSDVEDDQYQGIFNLCDNARLLQSDSTGVYKNFCKKLSINMLLLADRDYKGDKFIKYCDILYMWMYFEINKNSIPNTITEPLFNALAHAITTKRKKIPCLYFNFNEIIHEPTKLMNLHIFNNNIETIQSLLKDNVKSKDCNLKKYIYECVDIYNMMQETHSFPQDCTSSLHKSACEIINMFNRLYSFYIYNKNEIHHKFPELSNNAITNVIDGCPTQGNTGDSTLNETPQTDTSMRRVVSPVLSAMAGIPPFLAIIYKFTPVRKFLSFRNKKNSRVFSNLGEDVENELIIQQFEDTKINSVHPKYNVAYGPV